MAYYTDGTDDYIFSNVKKVTYFCIFRLKMTAVPFDASSFDSYSHTSSDNIIAMKAISVAQMYAFI